MHEFKKGVFVGVGDLATLENKTCLSLLVLSRLWYSHTYLLSFSTYPPITVDLNAH